MSFSLKTTIVLLVVCLGVITVEESRIRTSRAREAAAALQATNAIAERDSTRDLAQEHARVARLMGDSIRVVEKRVVQVKQKKDALDRALDGERRAKFELVARVDSLQRVATASVRADSNVRRAKFVVRKAPYTIGADVSIAAPPDSGRITLSVVMDPIPIEARIRCEKPDEHGVGAAAVVVSTPRWAGARMERIEQAPEVCAAARLPAARTSLFSMAPVIGVGLVSAPKGRPAMGYFFGMAVRVLR